MKRNARHTLGRTLGREVFAALTVTLIGIPQCLAYALMAGLPPEYGLATAAVPGFVAAVFGRSPQVITGPTNTTGLLILVALTPFLADNGLLAESALPVLATLTLLAGALRLLAALTGGAALVEFLPESVLIGFTAGAGILIAVMQLDEGLGLTAIRSGSFLGELAAVAATVGQLQWPALIVTAVTVALVGAGAAFAPRLPVPLFAVLVAALAAYWLGLDHTSGLPVVGDRSPVPRGWPPGALPRLDLELIASLLAPAAAIALLGTLELTVASRQGDPGGAPRPQPPRGSAPAGDSPGAGGGDARASGASPAPARPDLRREIVGQGLANVTGAFTSAFPASASLTRSALAAMAGGRSRLTPALSALLIVPVLFFGGPVVAAIPQASLAGVLIVIAYRMVATQPLRRIWVASRVTRSIMAVTFLGTLFLPLELAILGGAGLGAVIHLAQTNRPRLQLLEPRGGRLVPIDNGDGCYIVVVEVSGDMHYAATQQFMRDARALIPRCADHVILDLSHARAMRFAALLSLEELARHVSGCGGQIHLAGVAPHFVGLLERAGSELSYTPYDREPLASVRACLRDIVRREDGD